MAGDGVDVEHVHGIDLLESAVLALHDEEKDDEDENAAAAGEDKSVEIVDCVGDETGEEGEHEVPEPVAGGSDSHGRSTIAGGVELSDDGPDERSPSGRKGGDEQAREGDKDGSGRGAILRVDLVEGEVADERVYQEAHHHPGGASHECLSASAVLHDPETNDGACDVDGPEDNLGHVAVADSGGTENGGAVVEEEVRSSELLAGLFVVFVSNVQPRSDGVLVLTCRTTPIMVR